MAGGVDARVRVLVDAEYEALVQAALGPRMPPMRTHMAAFGTYMYVLTAEHPQADPHAARALLSDNARGLGGRASVSHQGHCPDLSAAGTRIHRRCRGHWQPSAAP